VKQIAGAILLLDFKIPFSLGKRMSVALLRVFVLMTILFLFAAEFLRVYLVMPFPGSQSYETVQLAWWINSHILFIRIFSLTILGIAILRVYIKGRLIEKICLTAVLPAYVDMFFLCNHKLDAENIFHQPATKSFTPLTENMDKTKLVIGVVINGTARAYPIQLIGYHHQVIDTVGNEPVMITYCTVCRTGRVYSTLVNGSPESFRLVGMDHFNAVFEDQTSKTWWQQASGLAIAGPLKGSRLKEIPSRQLTIETWMRQNPGSLIMSADPLYNERYFRLEDYDRGTMQSSLVRRNYLPWQPKSWIIGVKNEFASVAYDWNDLVKSRIIEDSLPVLPILLAMETDTTSFHVYDRRIEGAVLRFNKGIGENNITDYNTNSVWNMDGFCISGPLKGQQLKTVQAYNEFWHSWERFQFNPRKYVLRQP
jgi:hypothetical protein